MWLAKFEEKRYAIFDVQVDKQDTDKILFTPFEPMYKWAILAGNVMVWGFTVIQWNAMGRSINANPSFFATYILS